jgi:hypothetical protein
MLRARGQIRGAVLTLFGDHRVVGGDLKLVLPSAA